MNAAPWPLRRLGIVMEPDLADPCEAASVLNPAVARGPDGQLYLLPRLVAAGNYSRISLARVLCDPCGTPTGVERRGVVLTPRTPHELNAQTGGGVENPRVTSLAARGRYVMIYTALGPPGPRIAAAVARDLVHWHRKGLVQFARLHGLDLAAVDNKDGLHFPEPVSAPEGRPARTAPRTRSLPEVSWRPVVLGVARTPALVAVGVAVPMIPLHRCKSSPKRSSAQPVPTATTLTEISAISNLEVGRCQRYQ